MRQPWLRVGGGVKLPFTGDLGNRWMDLHSLTPIEMLKSQIIVIVRDTTVDYQFALTRMSSLSRNRGMFRLYW